jgi:hypothetical protein
LKTKALKWSKRHYKNCEFISLNTLYDPSGNNPTEFDNNNSHLRSGGNLDMIPELKDDDMRLNIIEVPQ